VDYEFILNTGSIPKSEGFIYLGLPVGTEAFVEAFYNKKMSKCEKSLYSLKNICCNLNRLYPHAIGFIYKQYCQSISLALNLCTSGSPSLLYEKHKVFGWRQCTKKSLTEKIFDNLSLVNSKNKLSNLFYLSQLSLVVASKELGHTNMQEVHVR